MGDFTTSGLFFEIPTAMTLTFEQEIHGGMWDT